MEKVDCSCKHYLKIKRRTAWPWRVLMYKDGRILIGKNGTEEITLDLKMANRHGMIAGATGTGKTVSLKVLAESFSDAGVPVFLADIKGDLGSLAQEGEDEEHVTERVQSMNLAADGYAYKKYPVMFWDVYGQMGMPLRTTVSEMGPLLLARVLGLNDLQKDILSVIFRIADDESMLLIDTKDLKAMLNYVKENAAGYAAQYGNIAPSSIAAITRAVVALETQGAEQFFGEPALAVTDLFQTDQGQGVISVLDCRRLILNPDMYSTMLLWMLSELYETLPEVGDCPKPKMVFFFDEAHMLFEHASDDLLMKIEQVVKLIRSKGAGIFFVTQNPADIPDSVMSQLGNKIQHALHAYSPKEIRAVKAAADTYRPNPDFDTQEAILNLATGEALVSILGEDGVPGIVKRCMILPPQSLNRACDDSLRDRLIKGCLLYSRYASAVDRDSAYEFLQRKGMEVQAAKQQELAAQTAAEAQAKVQKTEEKAALQEQKLREKEEKKKKTQMARVAASVTGTVGREIGNTIGKSVGGSFGKRIGGNLGSQFGRSLLGTLFKL